MKIFLSKVLKSPYQKNLYKTSIAIDLRNNIRELGFCNRITQSGWILSNVGIGIYGLNTTILIPQTIIPDNDYSIDRKLEDPPMSLHTICSTIHQIGVHSYYCVPSIGENNNTESIIWQTKQLGIPLVLPFTPLIPTIKNFSKRDRKYQFLRYNTDASQIPITSIPEEFTKEHLHINFQNEFMCEMSDIDGILWGEQYTYPIEIKEKTAGYDAKVGDFFGIDIGPFVKLAYYAAKKGNLHSLFFVKEINNISERELLNWWFITFEKLALFASWIPISGGISMQGGNSTVVKIPKSEFTLMTKESLSAL